MAKPMQEANVYVIGGIKAPSKIGITRDDGSLRLSAACRLVGKTDLILHGIWHHAHAFLVEKFAHIYLQDFQIKGEWFDVPPEVAVAAVQRTLLLANHISRCPLILRDWFERAGIDKETADAFLSERPRKTPW
jgi:Meiotically up-regulated gene 113